MSKREYWDYLQDIIDALNAIEDFVQDMDRQDFVQDLKTIYAVRKALEIIGEATKKVPHDFKEKYPDIPWRQMAGMRDILVHEYFGIKVDVLWETVQQDIPKIKISFLYFLCQPGVSPFNFVSFNGYCQCFFASN